MEAKIKNATAAILCGGKSRRMGFDKAFLKARTEDRAQYLLLQTAETLDRLFEQIVLVSNRKDKFESQADFGNLSVIEDLYLEKGPLGGIISALKQVQTDYIFVMACDMPLTDISLIGSMYRRLGQKQVLVCSHQERLEPLFAFYHKTCIPVFETQIEKEEFKLRSAFPFLDVGVYELKDEETGDFVNLNTPEDVLRWSKTPRSSVGSPW